MKRLLEKLHQRASATPLRPCVVDPDGTEWTWGAMHESVRQRGQQLADRGSPGPTVAIQLPSGGALWCACLAAVSQGFDALLLPEHPHELLRARVARERTISVTVDATWDIRPSPPGASPIECAHSCGGVELVSSGTTGFPQIVRRSSECVDLIAEGLVAHGVYTADDVVGSFLPMHHAYGFEHAFIGPLCAGATVWQRRGFGVEVEHELLRAGVTVLPMVPATLAALADLPLCPHRLRRIVSAGSPLSPRTRERLRSALGVNPVDLYGATELGTIWLDEGEGGTPVKGVTVRVDAQRGQVGEIIVESRTNALPAPVHTGDLGIHHENGRFSIVGRTKLVFDVGGLKVNPYEVEAALEAHPSVRAAVVEPIVVSDAINRVGARIERKEGSTLDAAAVRTYLQGKVPDHAVPRSIEFVGALPRTPSGKIQRTAGSPSRAPVVARPRNLAVRHTRDAWTKNLFDSSAAGYDAASGVAFMGAGGWYRKRMLRMAGLAPGTSVLDVGSGTGMCAWIAQEAVGSDGRAVALDPSPGMLQVARKRGVRETIVGHAEDLPFEEGTFDIVSMSYMLRHIEDLTRAFSEARRVLRPGGKLVIMEVSRPPGRMTGFVFRLLMRHALPPLGVVSSARVATYPMMRYWAESIDVAVSPDVIVAALESAGFNGVRHLRELTIFSCYRGIKLK